MAGFNNIGPNSGIKVGYIANEPNDQSEQQDSHQKFSNPLTMGSSVDPNHLSFSSLMSAPSNFGQQSFPGILDPGTVVYYLAQEGMNGGIILGHSSSINGGGAGSGGGGTDLSNSGHLGKVRQSKLNVNVPPEIQETTERGAKVKKIKEKGEQHSLDLLDGLPIHGALFDMTGFRIPEIKKVPTAKMQGQQMLDQNMMGQLMGQVMSMSGMLQGLMGKGGGGRNSNLGGLAQPGTFQNETVDGYIANVGQTAVFFSNTAGAGPGNAGWGNVGNNRLDVVIQKLPPNMQKALRNYSLLVQGFDNTNLSSSNKPQITYLTDGIVHPETVLTHAEQMLSQVTNVSDLMYVMRQLQSNTAYHGVDKIANVTIATDTAWGKAKKTVDINGNVTINYSNTALRNMANFTAAMANTQIAGGFGSLPSNTKLIMSKVRLPVYEEANANVKIAKFTTNANSVVYVKVYSPELPNTATDPQKIIKTYTSDGKKVKYDVGRLYVKGSEVISIDRDTYLTESQYVTSTGSFFTLKTPAKKGSVIRFIADPVVAGPVTVNPTGGGAGGTGGGKTGGGGGGIGQNIMGQMFGKGSQTMQEMMKRLHPGGEKESMKMTQTLNQGQDAMKLLEIAKKTINGGDPLMKNLFG